jgi:CRISPR-associated endonuclease/helicase Cas3
MIPINFDDAFDRLTEYQPFPWQRDLYETWFSKGKFPDACTLPTGLGKTSVIAVWLIGLATHPDKMPRRLVYVVNRRTVVDQTTEEVEKYRRNLRAAGLWEPLARMSGVPLRAEDSPLAVSTLRGQFADNREWSADPSRPAVISGTVDMIGSRLLFSGYGVGMKGRPLHAGFLGQDVLFIHDEAHLEPAFQDLVKAIECEQKKSKEFRPFRVMELTATSRGEGAVFELTPEEKAIPPELPAKQSEPIHHVWQRITSKKALRFHPVKRDSVANRIGEIARGQWKESGKAILIFVRTIDDVRKVQAILTDKKKGGIAEDQVQLLTGTMRGKERDDLATTDPVFARFSPSPGVEGKKGTVYLICTTAGEVGVDISADHMVCDLSTLDSMAQRFGRVNRRGEGAAMIDVVFETDPNPKPPSPAFEAARWKTKQALERLAACGWSVERYDASPSAIGVVMKSLTEDERKAAFAPPPTILPTTDMLFDAWGLTTVTGKLPSRPAVEPYLHGLTEWDPPVTQVAWREEVKNLQPKYDTDAAREDRQADDRKTLAKLAAELLDDFPLKPHELLQDRMTRVRKTLDEVAETHPSEPAWVVDEEGNVVVTTLGELSAMEKRDGKTQYVIDSRYCTILLPPSVGGLNSQGMLDANSPTASDVSCEWYLDKEKTNPRRARSEDDTPPDGMRLIRRIPLPGGGDESDPPFWYWFEVGNEGGKSANHPVEWRVHVKDVEDRTAEIVDNLPLDDGLRWAVKLAAKYHDHGKRRKLFQLVLGNPNYPQVVLAKSGRKGGRVEERYRHEFGSLLDVQKEPEFKTLTDDEKDLVLHLIATHHGRARPHFPADEAFDPDHSSDTTDCIAREVPRRFAKLQRKYGRWGLAYLESLLRAADWAASAKPSEYLPEDEK